MKTLMFTLPLIRPARYVLPVVIACAWAVQATSFGGEWRNVFEFADEQLDTTVPRFRAYEDIHLYARKVGGSDISAFTDLRFTNRFGFESRKAFEVAHLYAEWDNEDFPVSARMGRQRVFEAITQEYLDGLSVRADLGQRLGLLAFGGLTEPSRYGETYITTSLDSGAVNFGARLDARLPITQVGLVYQHEVGGGGAVIAQAIMADVEQKLGRFGSLFGLFAWNFAADSIYQYEIGTQLRPVDLVTLDLGFIGDYREPDTSSLFGRRVFAHYRELRARALVARDRRFSVSGGYFLRLLEDVDDPAPGVEARLSMLDRYVVGYRHEWGVGGRALAIDASAAALKTEIVIAGIGGFFSRYDLGETDADNAWAVDVFANLGPSTSWWNLRVKLQTGGNRYYDYDTRIYAETIIRYSRFTR